MRKFLYDEKLFLFKRQHCHIFKMFRNCFSFLWGLRGAPNRLLTTYLMKLVWNIFKLSDELTMAWGYKIKSRKYRILISVCVGSGLMLGVLEDESMQPSLDSHVSRDNFIGIQFQDAICLLCSLLPTKNL